MAFTDLIGTAFRFLSHRKEIEDVASKFGPIVQEVVPLIEKIAPGTLSGLLAAPGTLPPPQVLPPQQQEFTASWLQDALNKVDSAGLAVDGDYGDATRRAVANFQKKRDLVPDGWAGVKTSAALYAALQAMAS